MSNETTNQEQDQVQEQEQLQEAEAMPEIPPAQLQFALERLRSQQNMVGGVLAGLVAAVVGAGVWAGVTIVTNYQIGWMAVGVGFIVGLAIRVVGKGVDKSFGVAGAILALLGCAAGNLLAYTGIIAQEEGMAFTEVLALLNPAMIQEIYVVTFSPIDLVFYGLAIYLGYQYSFRRVTEEDLKTLLSS